VFTKYNEEVAMAGIAVLYCKKVKDHSCIACMKCYKGMAEKNAQFAQHDVIDLVAMTDCGDCPGLVIPRIKLLTGMAESMGRKIDAIHLGTCMKLAMETAECPIDFEDLQVMVKEKFGLNLILGTHSY
jgi:predicted metal-binding protein